MGDIAVENCAVYPYWVRCGRVRHCTFLLKTLHKSMALLISTGDVALQNGTVDT